jgi:enamine deaminase RidA (YjgF/YER057c/UK114 family)
MMDSDRPPEARLGELGIDLPEAPAPVGMYVPVRRSGDLLFVSGHAPWSAPRDMPVFGRVGTDLSLAEAQQAARLTGLNIVATLRAELGRLDRVAGIIRVFGMVNCAPGFTKTPEVINGCSAVFDEVFGARGHHARSAIGVAELPFGYAVEIEAVVEVA